MMYPCIITVMSTIELTSSIDKSGRLAVCQNETIVYRCRTTIVPSQSVLIWNVDHRTILFSANETSSPFRADDMDGRFFAYLQNYPATDDYLLSYLVIPYIPEWNGMTVKCMNRPIYKDRLYVITGKSSKILVHAGRIDSDSVAIPSNLEHPMACINMRHALHKCCGTVLCTCLCSYIPPAHFRLMQDWERKNVINCWHIIIGVLCIH